MRKAVRIGQPLLYLSLLVVSGDAQSQSKTPQEIRESITKAGGPERYLEAVGAASAKKVGQMVDAETELVSVSVAGLVISGVYRLPNVTNADLPNLAGARAVSALKSAEKVCVAPYASVLINDFGAIYKYAYFSSNQQYLFGFQLDRSTCAPGYRW